ncbi:MAG: isopentenyl-diphosphate Delta-isomerase [Flavobacteriales bacterium]|nr:isopentenyl-diphosphate Delta-isomerase [Flavobacteriales bacterium]
MSIEKIDNVILVNEQDEAIGTMEKMEAHRKGFLHRAFSVFVFNNRGELLIQRRANEKYHSGGLWTNTCCSHPRSDENTEQAAHRRLLEEMGFDCDLARGFSFMYKADLENGLIEHEFDHVFIGQYDGDPKPDRSEVDEWLYVNCEELDSRMQLFPDEYTEWFKIALPLVFEWNENKKLNFAQL